MIYFHWSPPNRHDEKIPDDQLEQALARMRETIAEGKASYVCVEWVKDTKPPEWMKDTSGD